MFQIKTVCCNVAKDVAICTFPLSLVALMPRQMPIITRIGLLGTSLASSCAAIIGIIERINEGKINGKIKPRHLIEGAAVVTITALFQYAIFRELWQQKPTIPNFWAGFQQISTRLSS